jgi:predicted dehydrogenase
MEPVRIAFIGAGKRAQYMYARIVAALPELATPVGVWSRSAESSRRLGKELGLPSFIDMAKLKSETGARAGIVAVSYAANGEIALEAVENGFHVLTETPLAPDPAIGRRIIETAGRLGLKVEVAEQFHRRPDEQIKLALVRSGVFGDIYSSFNDFAGHGYHGVSVMRSYLGFGLRPLQVAGSVHEYGLDPHWSMFDRKVADRKETQEHGIVEFEGGKVGIFHWSSSGYDSATRWWRSSRFYGRRGMGISYGTFNQPVHDLTILGPDQETVHRITLHRELERCDGGALVRYVAATGLPDMPKIEWFNPFGAEPGGKNPEWHDDEIGVASCLKSLVDAINSGGDPSYGAAQGLLDQEIILALRASAASGGVPVKMG